MPIQGQAGGAEAQDSAWAEVGEGAAAVREEAAVVGGVAGAADAAEPPGRIFRRTVARHIRAPKR